MTTLSRLMLAGTPNPLAAKISTTGWDGDGGAFELPAGAVFADIYIAAETYLQASGSAAAPSVDGCRYPAGSTVRLPVLGTTHLHYKGVATGAVEVTAFTKD